MVAKRKNGLNSFEVVSNLGVEVGHLKTARTDTLVRDTADYRLSSKQLKWNELPKKILTELREYKQPIASPRLV